MKFFYQKVLGQTLSYLSLNPVIYEKKEDGHYHKQQMDCDCIHRGLCDKATTCQLLLDAPEIVENNKIRLRNKKLGQY